MPVVLCLAVSATCCVPHNPTCDEVLPVRRSDQPRVAARHREDQVPVDDGTLRGLRSRGPTAVSASSIRRFSLRLGGSSTGRAVAGAVVGSIIPSITLAGPPACA